MKFYVMTDVGRKRASNQDAFCCARLDNGVEFVVLCDGMGGHRGGNVASEIAVRGFRELLAACMTPELRPKELKSLLSGIIVRVSRTIEATAEENPDFSGMGSTVVLAVRCGKKLCVAHVGDSRAYLYRAGKLRRLTRDHSLVQDLIDRGEITPEEGETHPHRNVITRTLGYAEDSEPEIMISDIKPADRFLLCSDGLTVTVRDGELEEILNTTPCEDLTEVLVSRALAGGGPDNITVGILYEEEREGK
ncbi:MAG: Stp1/IreP family PP2C-type Ser/Thr phosphatase [Clostridia bacterium]|nr:Stp1/IreP family PP2C-type Ser/Thr phosphatase [Clostridia bacterium]MBQ4324092.1 Stp1/IreP family PP2C-type Ser/Thr phosphatase [Clostridia bacterium]